jgi:ATP-dependent helicase HepA
LIIHKLLLNERIERVLIITPEPLVNQWFVEMIRKFNLAFTILDEKTCDEIEVLDPDVNPFEEKQLVLCSLPFLSESDFRQEQLFDTKWDLVVVDEAHNLHWSPDDPSSEYDLIERISIGNSSFIIINSNTRTIRYCKSFC